jgi:Uma2 family endonuclease
MSAAHAVRYLESGDDSVQWSRVQLSFDSSPFPMLIRPKVPMTEDELLRFCCQNKGFEVECEPDGTLYVMTPAGAKTSRLNVYLNRELDLWAEQNGRGLTFGSDVGVRFSDSSMRAPDAAWTARSRYEALDEAAQERFLPFCPEFIAELRSPSDTASRAETKMEFWMSRGAQLGWLIDPQRKLAMIYRPGAEPETLLRPEFLDGEGPVIGFRLKMQRFWE